MSSIWEPDYDIVEDFRERTERALENRNSRTFLKDADLKTLDEGAVKWLKSILDSTKDVLEVGCGYGRWAYVLKNFYSSYTGVDITESRIKYAKEEYPDGSFHLILPCNWEVMQNHYDLTLRQFDAIFSISCLQHLKMQDAIDTLKIMRDHLKPDGIILLHEARMEFTTEDEAEEIYAHNCPRHIIQKPISLFEKHVPELKWEEVECNKKHHHQFLLRIK